MNSKLLNGRAAMFAKYPDSPWKLSQLTPHIKNAFTLGSIRTAKTDDEIGTVYLVDSYLNSGNLVR